VNEILPLATIQSLEDTLELLCDATAVAELEQAREDLAAGFGVQGEALRQFLPKAD
jgi:hypothetical protein